MWQGIREMEIAVAVGWECENEAVGVVVRTRWVLSFEACTDSPSNTGMGTGCDTAGVGEAVAPGPLQKCYTTTETAMIPRDCNKKMMVDRVNQMH